MYVTAVPQWYLQMHAFPHVEVIGGCWMSCSIIFGLFHLRGRFLANLEMDCHHIDFSTSTPIVLISRWSLIWTNFYSEASVPKN